MTSKKLIRLSKSCISSAEKKAVMKVLDKEFLGMGEEVELFEKALTEYFGRPTLCIVNGTAALHLSLQACGIGLGDEVLVSSLTYVASFQAISATGAKPVACDINSDDLMINLKDAEDRLSPRTKAIMPVHYSGGVGNLDSIYTFATKHGLRVIEDAAHAFGTNYNKNRVGSFGDIACFSFDGIKNITSGEGGCVVTDDQTVLDNIKDARLLGVEKDSDRRYSGKRSWEFNVSSQGWRYHMSNIMAAIGLEQLKSFPAAAKTRQYLAQRYDELFYDNHFIQPLFRDYRSVVPHIYVVQIRDGFDRKILQDKLLANGIQTGIHYQPNHLLSYYSDLSSKPLPTTEYIYPKLLTLPLHVDLTESDVEYVARILTEILYSQDSFT